MDNIYTRIGRNKAVLRTVLIAGAADLASSREELVKMLTTADPAELSDMELQGLLLTVESFIVRGRDFLDLRCSYQQMDKERDATIVEKSHSVEIGPAVVLHNR